MDNDSGWDAREITLIGRAHSGHHDKLTLPCRWVELVQAWDGQAGSYFLVSGTEPERLTELPWEFVAFTDGLGKSHRYRIDTASRVSNDAIRLMRAG